MKKGGHPVRGGRPSWCLCVFFFVGRSPGAGNTVRDSPRHGSPGRRAYRCGVGSRAGRGGWRGSVGRLPPTAGGAATRWPTTRTGGGSAGPDTTVKMAENQRKTAPVPRTDPAPGHLF
ncbi:hypothetical protein GCM10010271_14800 [Streptomyces kurssanovii]|nr:hypothetical protein GCM10010271_14800 [Streptomyces kurssanovii]